MKLIISGPIPSYPSLLTALARSKFHPTEIITLSPTAKTYGEKFSVPVTRLPRVAWCKYGEGVLVWGCDWELIEEAIGEGLCVWVVVEDGEV